MHSHYDRASVLVCLLEQCRDTQCGLGFVADALLIIPEAIKTQSAFAVSDPNVRNTLQTSHQCEITQSEP